MKKIDTLKKNYEFKNVITKGRYFIKKQIIVYIVPNREEKNLIGIAINTKLCNAVRRNKIKRKIRENYLNIQKNLKKGYNIVFLWNKKVPTEEAEFNEIKKEMLEIFREANILKEEN